MNGLKKGNPVSEYASLLAEVKERIRKARYQALKAVNTELVGLYCSKRGQGTGRLAGYDAKYLNHRSLHLLRGRPVPAV